MRFGPPGLVQILALEFMALEFGVLVFQMLLVYILLAKKKNAVIHPFLFHSLHSV